VDVFSLGCDGEFPSLDFLRELKWDGSPDLARLTRMLDETAENGVIENNEYRFKNLKNGLYEFKAYGGARLLCFLDRDVAGMKRLVICTNGVVKKRNKHGNEDIDLGIRMRAEYFAAKKAGSLKLITDS
jgi:hypothetical protein